MLGPEYTIIFIAFAILKLSQIKFTLPSGKIAIITLALLSLIYKISLLLFFKEDIDNANHILIDYRDYNILLKMIIINSGLVFYLLHNYINRTEVIPAPLLFVFITVPTIISLGMGIFLTMWFLDDITANIFRKIFAVMLMVFCFVISIFHIHDYHFYLMIFMFCYLLMSGLRESGFQQNDLMFSLLFLYYIFGDANHAIGATQNIFKQISYIVPVVIFSYKAFFEMPKSDYWTKCFYLSFFAYIFMQSHEMIYNNYLFFVVLGILIIQKNDWNQIIIKKWGALENAILTTALPIIVAFSFRENVMFNGLNTILILLSALVFSRTILDLKKIKIQNVIKKDEWKFILLILFSLCGISYIVLTLLEYRAEGIWPYSFAFVFMFSIAVFTFYKLSIHFDYFFEKRFLKVNNNRNQRSLTE